MKKYRHIIKKGLISISLLVPLTIEAAVSIGPVISKTRIVDIIGAVIDFILAVSVPVAVIMFIIAGYLFITAAGEPEKIKIAKKMVIYAFIGFLIVLSAKGIVEFFKTSIGV